MTRPVALLRVLAKAPALLYDIGLGWVFGRRFMLLTHRGRRTGRVYRTFVEVIEYEAATGTCIVLSGWGTRSDWFRNIAGSPAVQVQLGRRAFQPQHRVLTGEEAERHFMTFRRRHWLEWRLGTLLFGPLSSLPLVEFRTKQSANPDLNTEIGKRAEASDR